MLLVESAAAGRILHYFLFFSVRIAGLTLFGRYNGLSYSLEPWIRNSYVE